jgi:membrane-bound serine protease (ClpP class)
MAPGTNTGAAHPVLIGSKPDDVMKMKMENDAAAFMRSYVSKRGRNVTVAESTVRESKAFSDQEALSQHLIDYIAKDEHDLLTQVNGKTVQRFDGTSTVMKTESLPITDYEPTLRERIMGFIVDPNIAFLIMAIGAISLYVEFNHPGAIIPGVIGIELATGAVCRRHPDPRIVCVLRPRGEICDAWLSGNRRHGAAHARWTLTG